MELTQTIRDSTIVEHARVAAQQQRKLFIVQLRDNAYDDPASYARPGLAKIIEEIEDSGWQLDRISPSQTKSGELAQLFLFRPDHAAADARQQAQNQTYPEPQGYESSRQYGGEQYSTGGQYPSGWQPQYGGQYQQNNQQYPSQPQYPAQPQYPSQPQQPYQGGQYQWPGYGQQW